MESNVWASATKYIATHDAMSTLTKLAKIKSNWCSILKPLAKDDVQHLSEKADEESDGKKMISWIWVVQGVADKGDKEDPGMQEGMLMLHLSNIQAFNYVVTLSALYWMVQVPCAC